MRLFNRTGLALVAGLMLSGFAGLAHAGMWSGLPAATASPTTASGAAATLPLTGNEVSAWDTGLSGGRNPQSETISVDQLKVYMFGNLGATTPVTMTLSGTLFVSDFGTCNSGRCVLTSSSLSTAVSANYTPTVLNSIVTASSIVNCSGQRGTTVTGIPSIAMVMTGAGVFTPVVRNLTDGPFNGTIKLSCVIVN